MVKKYRKKPVVIEAIQWTGENYEAVASFIGEDLPQSDDGECLYIETLEGTHCASPDDYIIKGIKGEFYPCKPDIFEATYELA